MISCSQCIRADGLLLQVRFLLVLAAPWLSGGQGDHAGFDSLSIARSIMVIDIMFYG
jgi:hypothetical protein